VQISKIKLKSSSIAEVVIALSIIALCFGVASLVFVRSMNVTSRFQDVKHQTEIQSKIMESLLKDNDSIPLIQVENVTTQLNAESKNDSLQVIEFLGNDNRVIWQQQIGKKK
jgi:hypothetical protein